MYNCSAVIANYLYNRFHVFLNQLFLDECNNTLYSRLIQVLFSPFRFLIDECLNFFYVNRS